MVARRSFCGANHGANFANQTMSATNPCMQMYNCTNVQLFPLWKAAVQAILVLIPEYACVWFHPWHSNVRVKSPDIVDGHIDICRVHQRHHIPPATRKGNLGLLISRCLVLVDKIRCFAHTPQTSTRRSLCVDSEKQRPSVRPPKIPPAAIMRHQVWMCYFAMALAIISSAASHRSTVRLPFARTVGGI